MTTELDRLLEIERDIERNLIRGNASVLDFHKEERKSLKSQIESKLAQADSVKDFCDMLGLKEAYGYNPRKVMQQAHEYVKKEHEELSQLRPIVQALREENQQLKEKEHSPNQTVIFKCKTCKQDESVVHNHIIDPVNNYFTKHRGHDFRIVATLDNSESILASSEVKQ